MTGTTGRLVIVCPGDIYPGGMSVACGPVKIVTWNCNAGFARNLPVLRALKPDVAVLCEVPALACSGGDLLEQGFSWQRVGTSATHGLAIAGFDKRLVSKEAMPGTGRWSTAGSHPAGFGLLGIWSCPPAVPGRRSYAQEVLDTLDAHATWILGGPVIAAGDLNISPAGSSERKKAPLMFKRFDELGLCSAYHAWNKVAIGEEGLAHPTHYFKRKRERPFIVDFVFVPKGWVPAITGVEVGRYDEWVEPGFSDHVPVIVDIDLDRALTGQ